MRSCNLAILVLLLSFVIPTVWGLDVEVNKTGAVKTIQDAVDKIGDQGGTVTITDSSVYEETVLIGKDSARWGKPITITSNKTGAQRPVISPQTALGPYTEVHSTERITGVAVFTDGCNISNLVVEANPDTGANGSQALFILADNVVVDNVLFRPRAGTTGTVLFPNSLVFLAQEGAGGSADAGGRNCNNTIIRNCDFMGVATDAQAEPTADDTGFLNDGENGQSATFIRTDHYTNSDNQVVTVTVEKCTFRYSYDAGLFFSNRSGGAGKLTLNVRDCFFDAFGKFQVGMRGCWLNAERCIFSRACQGNNGDGENSAIRVQEQDGRIPDANISNCLFVNCGSTNAQKAYYGGVNNHNGGIVNVNHCTFDLCVSGVTLNEPKPESELNVSNCIFSRIGYNTSPAVDVQGFLLSANKPFPAWQSDHYAAGTKFSAVFNKYKNTADGVLKAKNCIVWDIANEDKSEFDPAADPTGTRLAAGEVQMDGVQLVDPKLTNLNYAQSKPYELSAGSPAIDKAITALPDPGQLDLDGTARIVGKAADIGAQEFAGTAVQDWSIR